MSIKTFAFTVGRRLHFSVDDPLAFPRLGEFQDKAVLAILGCGLLSVRVGVVMKDSNGSPVKATQNRQNMSLAYFTILQT